MSVGRDRNFNRRKNYRNYNRHHNFRNNYKNYQNNISVYDISKLY